MVPEWASGISSLERPDCKSVKGVCKKKNVYMYRLIYKCVERPYLVKFRDLGWAVRKSALPII